MRLIPNQKTIIHITGTGINSENKQLAEDIQKSIIRKFRKRKYSQMHRTDSTQNTARSFGQFGQMVECSFKN